MQAKWYRMDAPADQAATVLDIHIIDFIGDWVDDWFNRNFGYELALTAKAFIDELAKIPANITTLRVHINSPGGDVFSAINIANALRDQQVSKGRTVETIVDGLAASAASLILMAGSVIRVADNALVMIHDPWMGAAGNSRELRASADLLDKFRAANIIPTYLWHSNLSADEIVALMEAETWMDADEAIAKGFATEKVEGLRAAASISPKAVAGLKVPAKFTARVAAFTKREDAPPVALSAVEVLRACREADCADLAEELVAANATSDQVQARLVDAKVIRAAAASRATEITALCATAKCPELAAGYIAGSIALDAVRAHLTTITAKLDRVEIDANLDPDHGLKKGSAVDVMGSYAALGQKRH